MHGLTTLPALRISGGRGPRAGASLLEIALALAIAALLAPPIVATASDARNSLLLRQAVENAARLLVEARWTAIREGGATVEFTTEPARGQVISATGDTVLAVGLGPGGVALHLSRARAVSRIRFGPLGLGWVASQTLRFTRAGEERRLVISSLGRASRR